MSKDFIQDPVFPECPIRNVLVRLSSKWALAVIYTLSGRDTPMRFRDLAEKNPDCSQKVLTSTLRPSPTAAAASCPSCSSSWTGPTTTCTTS